MQTEKKQQGMGLILWLFGIIVIAATTALSIKLAPIYLQNYMVKRILDSVREQAPTIQAEASGNINQAMQEFIIKRLQANNISQVTSNNILVSGAGQNMDVRIRYEVRVPLMANIDAILRFDNNVQVSLQ